MGTEAEWSWAKDQWVSTFCLRLLSNSFSELSKFIVGGGGGRSRPRAGRSGRPELAQSHADLGRRSGRSGRRAPVRFFQQHLDRLSRPARGGSDGNLGRRIRARIILDVISLEGTWPVYSGEFARLIGSLNYTHTHLHSSQNHYDASQTLLQSRLLLLCDPRAPDGMDRAARPGALDAAVGMPRSRVSAIPTCLTQDSNGVYGADITFRRLRDDGDVALLSGSPKNFSVKVTGSLRLEQFEQHRYQGVSVPLQHAVVSLRVYVCVLKRSRPSRWGHASWGERLPC